MSKQMSLCPSKQCAAANPHHELIGPTRAAQTGDTTLEGSYRCTYCQCVWRYGIDGRTKTILGHFDDVSGAYGWTPVRA